MCVVFTKVTVLNDSFLDLVFEENSDRSSSSRALRKGTLICGGALVVLTSGAGSNLQGWVHAIEWMGSKCCVASRRFDVCGLLMHLTTKELMHRCAALCAGLRLTI